MKFLCILVETFIIVLEASQCAYVGDVNGAKELMQNV